MLESFGWQLLRAGIGVAIAVALAFVVVVILASVLRLISKREAWARLLITRIRRPFRAALLVCFIWASLTITLRARLLGEFYDVIIEIAKIAAIAAIAWLVGALVVFVEDTWLAHYRTDVADNRIARRMHTQIRILRRLSVVIVVILALGSILLTFPSVRTVGASLLASAGVASIVAGLAAQSVLGNVFAGIQLAFSDAIRVDDVVVVETEWGTVEEITLTYVVVHIWDDRRMVLPSTYFTSTPYENWTRKNSELLGAVEFDLDFRVNTRLMREELDRILPLTDLWDGRVKVLQVTDALQGFLHVRVLATARDAPTLFDLRCYIRESLVQWMLAHNPNGLPRQRVQIIERDDTAYLSKAEHRRGENGGQPQGLFSGDEEAEERAGMFTGSITTIPSAERVDLTPEERASLEADQGAGADAARAELPTDTRVLGLGRLDGGDAGADDETEDQSGITR